MKTKYNQDGQVSKVILVIKSTL